jgi:hypothetical protein
VAAIHHTMLATLAQTLGSRPKTTLCGIAVIKVVLFLTAHWLLHAQPFVGSNAVSHWLPIARRMAAEGRFNGPDSRPDSKVGPGYAAVIAVAMKVFPRNYLTAVVVVQHTADLLTALAICLMAGCILSPPAAVLAAAAWQLFPPALIIAGWITSETLFTALLTSSTALLLMSFYREEAYWSALAGVALGFSAYFRTTPIALPLLYVPIWLIFRKRRDAVVFCAAAYLTILPWTLRNAIVLEDRIPVAVGFGSTLLQGSDSRFFSGAGKTALYPGVYADAARAGITKPASDHESGIDAWMGEIGIYQYSRRWRERPLSFLPFAAHKWLRLWYGTESAHWKNQVFLGLCSFLVVPWAFIQFSRWRLKWPAAMSIVGAQVFYFMALHWITLPEIRYMLPLYPLLLIGATGLWEEFLTDAGADRMQPFAEPERQRNRC